MKKALHFAVALPAILLFLCAPALADDAAADKTSSPINGFFLTPQIGTLGIGLNAGYQFNDIFKARFNANYLTLHTERTISDVDCDMDFSSLTLGVLADVHPFSGYFRLTGGLYYVNMQADATANLKSGKSYTIGDHSYTGAQLGSGEGSVKWQRFAPYLGLGFGPGEGTDSGFSFSADVGVLIFGDPKVSMSFTNPTASAALSGDVGRYESKAKNEIRSYLPVWPVLSLGVSYRF